MPFGQKLGKEGITFDFDKIYRSLVLPAIDAAGMNAIRADEEIVRWHHTQSHVRATDLM